MARRRTPRQHVMHHRRYWRVMCFLRMHPLDYESGTALVFLKPCFNCGRMTHP